MLASAQTLYVTADRTVANGNPINTSGFSTVVVGRDLGSNNFFGVDADITGGVSTTLRTFNDSITNLNAGGFNLAASVSGTATLNINQSIINIVTGNENGRVFFRDGDITSLNLNDFSTGVVSGGFLGAATLNNRSKLNVIGGALASITANTSSEVTLNGGTVQNNIGIGESSIIDVLAGTIGDSSSDQFSIENNARLNFINGNVSGGIRTINNAQTAIRGGVFSSTIRGQNTTSLTSVYGGKFGRLASIDGKFDLYGTSITFNNARTGTYSDAFVGSYNGVYWDLRGTLSDGTNLNATYFEDRASVALAPANVRIVAPAVVPEAGTFVLVLPALALLGAVAVRRRAHKVA